MGKETGLGANFYLDGIDLSGDTGSLSSISKGIEVVLMTGVDKSAKERLAGQLSGAINWNSFFNPTNAHPTLSTLPRTDRIATYVHKAAILGTPVANLVLKQGDYAGKRGDSGEFMLDVQTVSNSLWLDWGYSLTTGKRTDGGATNGTGVDFAIQGAPANFGVNAYLQAFAFTGTSVTVKLQHSSDNAVGDPYADVAGGAFTLVNVAPQSQFLLTARNLAIKRWLRVVTTGVFSNLVFQVSAVVNRTDMTL